MLVIIFCSLVLFQFLHYLADFPLQNEYHLGKFYKTNWVHPLASHVHIHSLMMGIAMYTSGLIALFMGYDIELLILITLSCATYIVNFVVHFIVDRIKASPNLGGRWKYPSKAYFNALGFDQFIHEVTNVVYVIVFLYFFII
jgi:hypothetical protein